MIYEKSWRLLGIYSRLWMVVVPLLPAVKVRTDIRKPFLYMLIIFIFEIRGPFHTCYFFFYLISGNLGVGKSWKSPNPLEKEPLGKLVEKEEK